MAISRQQLEQALLETTNSGEAARKSSAAFLASVESLPGFSACLLDICSGGEQRNAAATYLKNFVKLNWTDEKLIGLDHRKPIRTRVLETLLHVESIVRNQLTETLRIIASRDFSGKENTWPELVPLLRSALQSSDMLGGSRYETINVLLAVQAITKPFQYFLDPTVAREPVPSLLEVISSDLILPLYELVHHLTEQAQQGKGSVKYDRVLLASMKIFHLAVGSHMPTSLCSALSTWLDDILGLMTTIVVNEPLENAPEQRSRLKTWKKALQICSTLVTRHRRHINKKLPAICSGALRIVGMRTEKDVHATQERVLSLAFDLLSNILETGPGWSLLAPQFTSLLQNAIFPALILRRKDIVEWHDDEDEYLRKNLPSDLDETCGWRADLITPRRSALNLLGLIATSKGPNTKKRAKRKKGAKKDNVGQETAGELLVLPFLSQYPLPPDDATFESTFSYYAALLAYGNLQEFFRAQSPELVELILSSRVFPLYSFSNPSPFLLANANWLLGELGSCLPEAVNKRAYDSLIKAFLVQNVGGVNWRPVRASAAGALASLLEEGFRPEKWFPFLQAIASRIKAGKEEATLALQLLTIAAEVGADDVAPHVPYLVTSVKDEILKHLPPVPEPWPQVVEHGFAAAAALAQTWDSAEPDAKKKRDSYKNWKENCPALMSTFSLFLERAWITQECKPPPPCCLSDASVILSVISKYSSEAADDVSRLQLDHLLQVWAGLITDWNAWDEEEDVPIFDAIEAVVTLNGRNPLEHFAGSREDFEDTEGRCSSILDGMASFITGAMEKGCSAATWRACRLSHSLLHSTAFSFDGERAAKLVASRVAKAAFGRLRELSSFTVSLGKPLTLAIATCYIGLPETVEEALSNLGDMGNNYIVQWGRALAVLARSDALHLESELKLAVFCLMTIVQNSGSGNMAFDEELPRDCFLALLEASVRLREVQEQEGNEDEDHEEDEDEGDGGDNTEDDTEDDSDDDVREETKDEFLERYAETARDLEEEATDDPAEEHDHEIELGTLALSDHENPMLCCIQSHGHLLPAVPVELVSSFTDKFPQSKSFFTQL